MNVYDMDHWCRCLDLMQNRVDVINQMLGYGVPGLVSNPCRLRYEHGTYRVYVSDCVLCEFGLYEQGEIDAALRTVDGANDMVWYATHSATSALVG